MTSILQRARTFFTWWLTELSGLLPRRLVSLFRPAHSLLVLDIDETTLSIRSVASGQERDIGCFLISEIANPDKRPSVADSVRGLLDEAGVVDPEVKVRVPMSKALLRTLELPKAAEGDLRQALTFEMDRLTPFAPDDVYFVYRVFDQDVTSQRLRVELIVLPRNVLDEAVSLAHQAGLPADTVDVARPGDDGQSTQPGWNFLPEAQTRRTIRLQTAVPLTLTVVAFCLVAAAVYVPIHRDLTHLAQLEKEVAESKKQAELSRQLQEEFQHVNEQARFIFDNRLARPPLVEVLNELTRTLPDDTWLFRLRYTNGEIQAFGNSTAASALIGVVEQSPMFSDARFLAPITRDRLTDTERFQIGFNIVSAAKP